MSAGLWIWLTAALAYLAFRLWYDGWRGPLTPQETDRLFRILQTLKDRGVTVVLITHKLREIVAATDRVYVMRRGQIVAERRTVDTGTEELAELMVGGKVHLELWVKVKRGWAENQQVMKQLGYG